MDRNYLDRNRMGMDDYRSGRLYGPYGSEYRYAREGTYYDEWDEQERGGIMQMIKDNPIPAALIGAGLGVLIAGAFGKGTQTVARTMRDRHLGSPEDTFMTWLKDAYGMEVGGIALLEHRIEDAQDDPEMRRRLEEHLAETERHADRIKECIERRGGGVSWLKGFTGGAMGWVDGMVTEFAADEDVKNVLVDYTGEHFEIICYRSLIAAAEDLNDTHTAQVCRDILQEEERMASFLEGKIKDTTKRCLDDARQETQGVRSSRKGNEQLSF